MFSKLSWKQVMLSVVVTSMSNMLQLCFLTSFSWWHFSHRLWQRQQLWRHPGWHSRILEVNKLSGDKRQWSWQPLHSSGKCVCEGIRTSFVKKPHSSCVCVWGAVGVTPVLSFLRSIIWLRASGIRTPQHIKRVREKQWKYICKHNTASWLVVSTQVQGRHLIKSNSLLDIHHLLAFTA